MWRWSVANWMLTPGQVRELIRVHLLPPGLVVRTCYDVTCDGVMGVITDDYPLGLRCEFQLTGDDLSLSSDGLLARLRERLQSQISALAPQPEAAPFDLDATG